MTGMTVGDLQVDLQVEPGTDATFTIHFPDYEGIMQYIVVRIVLDTLHIVGHTASFHNGDGICPPLRIGLMKTRVRSVPSRL
jgi:hypothetical protein